MNYDPEFEERMKEVFDSMNKPYEFSFNERLVIISDIFKKLKLLGTSNNKDAQWWGKEFDYLYDLRGHDLMRYDTFLRDSYIEKYGSIAI